MDTTPGNLSVETLTGAPPSPQEVKVRTMKSDLASMAQSGGGLPQFQNVKITGVSVAPQAEGSTRKTSLIVAILSIVAVLIVLAAGYFAYAAFQKKGATSVPVTGGQ